MGKTYAEERAEYHREAERREIETFATLEPGDRDARLADLLARSRAMYAEASEIRALADRTSAHRDRLAEIHRDASR